MTLVVPKSQIKPAPRPYFEAKLKAGAATTVTYGTVDVSSTYVEAEAQAVSTALTALVTALRSRGVIL